jgi:GNAT superfamily N-acetyltransferase
MIAKVRPAVASDASACGRIIYEAFKGIAEAHGFPPDFPSAQVAIHLAGALIANPLVFAVAAEFDGQVVGSSFLWEGDPIRGVGPITVDPAVQGSGAGRQLMQAMLDRGRNAAGIRLVQDAFNTCSISLYASLGFAAKEPLMLMSGRPRTRPGPQFEVRPMAASNVAACRELCHRVHGFPRDGDVARGLEMFKPFVVRRDGRLTGYLTAATFWIANHGVAETEQDLQALIGGAAGAVAEELSLLVPIRQAGLFRWCLDERMRVVKPMTLMAIGAYREPAGAFFPSVFY